MSITTTIQQYNKLFYQNKLKNEIIDLTSQKVNLITELNTSKTDEANRLTLKKVKALDYQISELESKLIQSTQ